MVVISEGGMLALNIILLFLGPVAVAVLIATAPGGYKTSLARIGSERKVWTQAPALVVSSLVFTLSLAAIFSAANTYVSPSLYALQKF